MKITGLFYLYVLLIIVNFSQALRCGEKFNNKKCPNKQCCSYLGYCGRSREYCDVSYGCQSEFGRCYGKDSSFSSSSTITTITTTTTTTPEATTSNVINCGPKYGDKICPGDACCSESGQCSFDLESCGAGCQQGYGFCLPDYEYDKEHCLDCEDCFNCDDSPVDRLLCPKTCFKDGNKRTGTIEIEPCDIDDEKLNKLEHVDPEDLCNECNKCIDCIQFPDVIHDHPNACKRVSSIISTDGTCGPQHDNKVCPNNECCNENGQCGISEDSCGYGCQAGYGNCLTRSSTVCITCVECRYCENKFHSLICPSTCITSPFNSNEIKISVKLNKYNRKYECPKINKLCYKKLRFGEKAYYKLN